MSSESRKLVYCSGPLFCPEEIAGMTAIAETLEEAGYGTFLPHRDGLEPFVMKAVNDPRVTNKMFRHINRFVSKAIFALDIYQIVERCDSLVLNMNGRVPDEGGVVETAVAFTAGKPLVLYKNDHRTKFNGNDNSMLIGLSYTFSTVSHIKKIPEEIEKVTARVEASGGSPYKEKNVPQNMRKVVSFGRNVWKFMHAIHLLDLKKEDEYLDRLKEIVKMCETSPALQDAGWI